jgi:hypothetical protein
MGDRCFKSGKLPEKKKKTRRETLYDLRGDGDPSCGRHWIWAMMLRGRRGTYFRNKALDVLKKNCLHFRPTSQ